MFGVEFFESLLRVVLSEEEESKLKSYSDDKFVFLEKFFRELFNVFFVFKRVDVLFFVVIFDFKIEYLK